jgi:hypothetical protein
MHKPSGCRTITPPLIVFLEQLDLEGLAVDARLR